MLSIIWRVKTMLLTTPEIVWHSKDPVFSVDFHLSDEIWRLASSGADHTVKIWRILTENNNIKVRFLANLERHVKAVNVVKFSPDGKYLASGSDDCTICLWQYNNTQVCDETSDSRENWSVYKMLRGHIEDIYDICWSYDSLCLISGSVDNTAIVWDITSGDKISILKESHHYIQGVAWDHHDNYLATLGTDRALRIYGPQKSQKEKFKCIHSISKLNIDDSNKSSRMFLDETMSSFFRRLSFSTDSNLLIAPGGCIDINDKCINVTWVFTKSNLTKPVLYLPMPDKPSVVVRFCPILFQLRSNCEPMIQLPYRMVFAILTVDKVLLYDTQQTAPIAYISDIHYASLTDATWSKDGSLLVISSTDGYCTVISFDNNELGIPFSTNGTLPVTDVPKTPPTNHTSNKPRRITPIRVHDTSSTPVNAKHTPTIPINALDTSVNVKKPRRVDFITLT